jgi:hypothetical protein
MMKVCTSCKASLPSNLFSARKASPDGLQPVCKSCDTAKRKARKLKNPIAESEYQRQYRLNNLERRKENGRRYYVKTKCRHNSRGAAHYAMNKARHAELGRAWRAKNADAERERRRLHRLANLDRIRKARRRHYAENKVAYLEAARRREIKARRAMPPWADIGMIKEIYELREQITQETGIPHHVDHIIPLQGRNVCGLHVHNNLRVIPARENLKKSNLLLL